MKTGTVRERRKRRRGEFRSQEGMKGRGEHINGMAFWSAGTQGMRGEGKKKKKNESQAHKS